MTYDPLLNRGLDLFLVQVTIKYYSSKRRLKKFQVLIKMKYRHFNSIKASIIQTSKEENTKIERFYMGCKEEKGLSLLNNHVLKSHQFIYNLMYEINGGKLGC